MSDAHTSQPACDEHDCVVPTNRRRFLRDTFLSVAGALVAVGMTNKAALAMPLEFTESRGRRGTRHSYGIPATDGAQIDKDNEVIIVRWQSVIYAFALSCPHQNTALRWNEHDHEFQCPKHHSKYRPDGVFIEGRATRGMDRLAIEREPNGISVDVDKLFQQDNDPTEWAGAVVKL